MDRTNETLQWAANRFGIPVEDVVWYNSGICYDRIGVKTKKSADKVTAKVAGETVNGGMYDGMPLGGQRFYKDHYDIMC